MTRRATAHSLGLRFASFALLLMHAVFVGALACFFAVSEDPSGALAGWLGASEEPARGVVAERLRVLSTVVIPAGAFACLAVTWTAQASGRWARPIRVAASVLGAVPLLGALIRKEPGLTMGCVVALAALVALDAVRRRDAEERSAPFALALAAHAVLVVGEGMVSFGLRPLLQLTSGPSARAYADHPWPLVGGVVATALLGIAASRARRGASRWALGAAASWVLGQLAVDVWVRTTDGRSAAALLFSDLVVVGLGLFTGTLLLVAARQALFQARAGVGLHWLLPLGISLALLPFDLPAFAGSEERVAAARLRALGEPLIGAPPSAERRWARMPSRFLIVGRGGAHTLVDRDRVARLGPDTDLGGARWRDQVVFARDDATFEDLRRLSRRLPPAAPVYLARARPGRTDDARWARFAASEDAASGIELIRVYREGAELPARRSASTISLSRTPEARLAELPRGLDVLTDAAPSEPASDTLAPSWKPAAGRAAYRPGFPLAAQRAAGAAALALSAGMALTLARHRTVRGPPGSRRPLLLALGGVAAAGVATVAAIAGLFA